MCRKGNADITCDLTEKYTEAPTDGSPDDTYAEFEADVPEERLNDAEAYGLTQTPAGNGRTEGPPATTEAPNPLLEGSRTVPANLVGGEWIEPRSRADGTGYTHKSPDMLIIRRGPGRTVTQVDIVDVTTSLHHRFAGAHEDKRTAYEPLRKAIVTHNRLDDNKVTIRALALGVWGHVPESAVATLHALGLQGDVAKRLLRNLAVVCAKYSANCCQTRRKLEAEPMEPRDLYTPPPEGGATRRKAGQRPGTRGDRLGGEKENSGMRRNEEGEGRCAPPRRTDPGRRPWGYEVVRSTRNGQAFESHRYWSCPSPAHVLFHTCAVLTQNVIRRRLA